MANVLLGVTGSVAAVRTPDLYEELKKAGHTIKVVTTWAALYFFDPVSIDGSQYRRNPEVVIYDEDEWPGLPAGKRWQRDQPVLHIELRKWAEVFVIAPLDANTLAKLANGLSDNCLTCVWRAWDPERPVVLAPAMNTLMWLHALTGRHLRQLAGDGVPAGLDLDGLVGWINQHCPRLRIVSPQSKRLACGDTGVGAMADVADIAAAVDDLV